MNFYSTKYVALFIYMYIRGGSTIPLLLQGLICVARHVFYS